MKDHPALQKDCFRCDNPVAVSAEEMLNGQIWTTCAGCRRGIVAEATFAGTPIRRVTRKKFPKDEAQKPQTPAAPANQP